MITRQEIFDWLVPTRKTLLRPDEAARYLGWSIKHVYRLIDEGKLEAHSPTDRQRQCYTITRRSVVLVLAETALYDPDYFMERVEHLLQSCSQEQLAKIIKSATQLSNKL